jgi:restriction system protein
MNVLPILAPLIHILPWLTGISLLSAIVRSSWFKGAAGEALLRFSAYLHLDAKVYRRFHNVTLMTEDGSTQIDHVFVSRFGVFVVETKNMSGWIFGNADQPMWTQTIYRNSYRFQNPLRQNYKHTRAIESALKLSREQVISVVVFVGGSTFKTPMPPNVTYGSGSIRYIQSHQQLLFSDAQVDALCTAISAGRLKPGFKTSREHVRNLKRRHELQPAKKTEPACPKCGAAMRLKTVRAGEKKGSQFLGCSAYPRCRGMRPLTT